MSETAEPQHEVGTVGINIDREGVEIWWEPGDYEGPVLVKAVNAETGDVGISKSANDGYQFLTWPPGTYTDEITILKDDGGEQTGQDVIAHGTITVKIGD